MYYYTAPIYYPAYTYYYAPAPVFYRPFVPPFFLP